MAAATTNNNAIVSIPSFEKPLKASSVDSTPDNKSKDKVKKRMMSGLVISKTRPSNIKIRMSMTKPISIVIIHFVT